MLPVRPHSRQSIKVMTKPETTKKMSTPTKQPGRGSPAWATITDSTAMARIPCMSFRTAGRAPDPRDVLVPAVVVTRVPTREVHTGQACFNIEAG